MWVLQQSLVWIIHWRAPEPWESSSTCVDYWRFYIFSSYLQVKKDGLFVRGLLHSSCLHLLKAKEALFALVCCGANYYNIKYTGNTIRFLTIKTGPTNIIHFNNPSGMPLSLDTIYIHHLQNMVLLLVCRELQEGHLFCFSLSAFSENSRVEYHLWNKACRKESYMWLTDFCILYFHWHDYVLT